MDNNSATPFGGVAIFMFLCLGGCLMLVRECSAFIGMPW